MSAKYKGAFCEAKVRSVIKEVKCRVTFKGGLGSCTLSDDAIRPIDEQPLMQGANVKAKHPDKQEYLDAIINQIKVLWSILKYNSQTCDIYSILPV